MNQSDQSDQSDTTGSAATLGADGSEDIKAEQNPGSNAEKDPDHWVTGGEPATGAQRSYLQTLAEEASETVPADISKADASKKIDELQSRTGRGN
jgi:hypothetical protein